MMMMNYDDDDDKLDDDYDDVLYFSVVKCWSSSSLPSNLSTSQHKRRPSLHLNAEIRKQLKNHIYVFI